MRCVDVGNKGSDSHPKYRMCGIALSVRRYREDQTCDKEDSDTAWSQLSAEIARRGPDNSSEVVWRTQTGSGETLKVRLLSSLLGLRGEQTNQPIVGENGILAWNGQVFDGLQLGPDQNDTRALFEALEQRDAFAGSELDGNDIRMLLSGIEGPYAFVYLDKRSAKVHFGRDPFGRRSLLISSLDDSNGGLSTSNSLSIASVRPVFRDSKDASSIGMQAMVEVSCNTIWQLDLRAMVFDRYGSLRVDEALRKLPRHQADGTNTGSHWGNIPRMNTTISDQHLDENAQPSEPESLAPSPSKQSLDSLQGNLSDSVRRRVENIPAPREAGAARVAVLFSGGIDCTYMAHLVNSYIPPGEPIDLLNVAFENPRAVSAAKTLYATQAKAAQRASRSRLTKQERKARGLAKLERGQHEVEGSGNAEAGPSTPPHSSPPIERSKSTKGQSEKSVIAEEHNIDWIYDVPDRITGRESAAELQRLHPERQWRFVEIDIPYEEAQRARPKVMALMYPSDTEMDLSLAFPLYFAARRTGTLRDRDNPGVTAVHHSQAKVLLSGLGADELLGGYARHRREYERGGWSGAIAEMQMDLDRLPSRNLGRDDRIISSHGVETRFPYLSISFASAMAALPIQEKCDLRYGDGIGDKSLLRIACAQAGLPNASRNKKRAMQFGTRSARMEAEEPGSVHKGMGARKIDIGLSSAS